MEDVALRFPFTVGRRASVAPGAVAAHALQHQALVGGDDADRNVVTQLLFLPVGGVDGYAKQTRANAIKRETRERERERESRVNTFCAG